MLILRDALNGRTRFDELEQSLGIAPNMLSRRLRSLVDAGLLERRRYSERPPRYEYLPTESGRDFRPVLIALLAWGNRHFAPEGASVQLASRRSGKIAEPVLVDGATGRPLNDRDYELVPGPAAAARTRRALAGRRQTRRAAPVGRGSAAARPYG